MGNDWNLIVLIFLQPLKDVDPRISNDLGNDTSPVNPEQAPKAKFPMVVTEFGIIKSPVNPEHPRKAEYPMVVLSWV